MHQVSSLLESDDRLAISNSHTGSSKVDLWVLLDYTRMVWVRKYQIELPVIQIRRFEEGDCWCSHIVSQKGDVLVDGLDWQFHYDLKDAASSDRVLCAALLGVFARCGRIVSCRKVFDRIVNPDLPAWNALLSSYARLRDAAAADAILELFGRMPALGVRPNEITLVAVVGACGELGALGHGVWAHAYAVRRRLAVNRIVATALVEMYAGCGRLDLAEQVFDAASDWDTRCCNAMLYGLAVHGPAALDLFDRMCDAGVPVDGVTLLSVIWSTLTEWRSNSGLSRIEHYGCVVDMLSQAGRLGDADKLVRGMAIAPNAAIYRSLIRACGIHGNLELGEKMVADLRRLEPDDSGNHVLISNFYARMDRWEDAKKARKEMKSMGIDKNPGSSLLDINGVLHEFLVGDKTHPASKEIYAMVEEIETRLNEFGHRSSTMSVLFDVEEEDKVDTLSYHSERFALAFALIAPTPGAPIRIIKNLRSSVLPQQLAKGIIALRCGVQAYNMDNVQQKCERFMPQKAVVLVACLPFHYKAATTKTEPLHAIAQQLLHSFPLFFVTSIQNDMKAPLQKYSTRSA
uniref:DYW domain-containing protein n=1 Tax=Leersia perrieri TaxID=77586 RepID=A0A0D9XNQ3_9ORYZ